MRLYDAGNMVQSKWDETPEYYPGIEIDEFVIMLNHIHEIEIVVGAGPCACPIKSTATTPGRKRRPTAIRKMVITGEIKKEKPPIESLATTHGLTRKRRGKI